MEFLYKLGDIYFSFPGKNCLNISKDIFEECFFIANDNFCLKNKEKSENIFSLINPELKTKFQMIYDNCEKKINLISAISFIGIENTKQTGQLFSNNENLNKDDLSLLSYNFFNALKKLENINLTDNKEKIEAESICYANIVKIELIKDKNKINSKKLLEYAEKSILKADFLGKEYKKKSWYKEITKLRKNLEKNCKEVTPSLNEENIMEKIENEFNEKFFNGEEIFIEFLLKSYPINGYVFTNDIISEFQKDKKKFLDELKRAYKRANEFMLDININKNKNINDNINEIKLIIEEKINNIINRL